jgi:hypothetical protein
MDERGRKYAPGARGRLPKRHLFIRGMLRCACGEAMLPRSASDSADVYVCRAHKGDATRCAVPQLRRDAVDGAALAMFEDVALDLEATRRHVEQQMAAQESETRGLLDRAERRPPRPRSGSGASSARSRTASSRQGTGRSSGPG